MDDDRTPSLGELFARVSVRLRQAMTGAEDRIDLGGLTQYQGRIVGWIEANEANGIIQRDLAELTGTRPASVSSLLQGLERDGWIERRADPSDSRRKTLHVTEKAREVVKRFEATSWGTADAALGGLDPAERRELHRLLGKIDRHLADSS